GTECHQSLFQGLDHSLPLGPLQEILGQPIRPPDAQHVGSGLRSIPSPSPIHWLPRAWMNLHRVVLETVGNLRQRMELEGKPTHRDKVYPLGDEGIGRTIHVFHAVTVLASVVPFFPIARHCIRRRTMNSTKAYMRPPSAVLRFGEDIKRANQGGMRLRTLKVRQ